MYFTLNVLKCSVYETTSTAGATAATAAVSTAAVSPPHLHISQQRQHCIHHMSTCRVCVSVCSHDTPSLPDAGLHLSARSMCVGSSSAVGTQIVIPDVSRSPFLARDLPLFLPREGFGRPLVSSTFEPNCAVVRMHDVRKKNSTWTLVQCCCTACTDFEVASNGALGEVKLTRCKLSLYFLCCYLTALVLGCSINTTPADATRTAERTGGTGAQPALVQAWQP